MNAELRQRVLEEIRPTPAETRKMRESAAIIIEKIRKKGYRAVLVGSAGRGTCLAGDKDLDIFVFFPKSVGRKLLEKRALKLGKEVLGKSAKTHYAEHPYVKGALCGFEAEIVPCYEMKTGAKPASAVDRSPLHHKYVLKHLKKGKRDDVLLLKQFLKGCDAYGAEHKTKGFSGYLCELLVIEHGSFERVLAAAKRFAYPLVLIDPVDANRNVAAAVSEEKLKVFMGKAAQYLKKPSENFFFPKKKPLLAGFDEKKTVVVSLPAPRVVEEILWSQLERLKSSLETQLKISGFVATKLKHWSDEKTKCILAFEFASLKVPETIIHSGPFINDAENAAAFKRKNKKWFVKNNRLFAYRKREFTDAKTYLKHLLKTIEVPSHFKHVVKKTEMK